jgi:predicted RNA-binding protein with RPS1 domain
MQSIPNEGTAGFDWEAYENSSPVHNDGYNKEIAKKYPDARVYSREPYAMELYEAMLGYEVHVKDFNHGDIIPAMEVKRKGETTIQLDLTNGLVMEFDLLKERKFCILYGSTPESFCDWVEEPENAKTFIDAGVFVYLSVVGTNVKGNLNKGHEAKTRQEFVNQIKDPTNAYTAKVKTRNKGGFIVEVMGVEAFLPGGLAAPNKIVDFEEYMSKDIMVMIEDYLVETKTFIVSNKKYIKHILPSRTDALDPMAMYTGTITGTAKYGIFVEFDEIFTGLLHYSKMTSDTRDKFKSRGFRPGDELNFWIKEITNDNRIILSEENPEQKLQQFDQFKEKNLGVVKNGKVVSIKPFGALVKLEKDIIGLVSKKELKLKKKFFEVGDDIIVTVDDVQKDKIYLSLIDESEELY